MVLNYFFSLYMLQKITKILGVFVESMSEDPFKIKCDVHPWMGAYLGVFDHPYFAVTDDSGSYTISGLPAGKYVIEAWHEKLGTQTADITVDDSGASQDFSFKKPSKKK